MKMLQTNAWLKRVKKLAIIASSILILAPGASLVSAQTQTHTVKAGEYLYLIANKYNITVSQLRTWNNLTSDLIYVGDVLNVSTPAQTSTYTIKAGDTLWGIATRYGVTVSQLKSWNGLTSDLIRVGAQLRLTAPTTTPDPTGVYTVKSGDTLWKIANQYGVTVAQLKAWNGLTSDFIRVGQQLKLTTSTTTPDPSPTTVYQVVAGDTLYKIAQRYGVTVAQLKEWNGLTSDLIQVGKRLHVVEPDYSENPVKEYTVKSGDTLYKIAKEQGVSVNELRLWNHLTTDLIRVGQVLKIAVY